MLARLQGNKVTSFQIDAPGDPDAIRVPGQIHSGLPDILCSISEKGADKDSIAHSSDGGHSSGLHNAGKKHSDNGGGKVRQNGADGGASRTGSAANVEQWIKNLSEDLAPPLLDPLDPGVDMDIGGPGDVSGQLARDTSLIEDPTLQAQQPAATIDETIDEDMEQGKTTRITTTAAVLPVSVFDCSWHKRNGVQFDCAVHP